MVVTAVEVTMMLEANQVPVGRADTSCFSVRLEGSGRSGAERCLSGGSDGVHDAGGVGYRRVGGIQLERRLEEWRKTRVGERGRVDCEPKSAAARVTSLVPC